jgi:hypothetical protein
MHVKKIVTTVLICAFAAGPAFAATPDGNWACTVAGAPAGSLGIKGFAYSYSKASGEAAAGTYLMYENVLQVTSGPLKALGNGLGYYVRYIPHDQRPAELVFNIGEDNVLLCSPS